MTYNEFTTRTNVEKKQAEEESKEREALAEIANSEYTHEEYNEVAREVLTKKQMKIVEKYIGTEREIYNPCFNTTHVVPKFTYQVIYDIKKYLGWVA